MRVKRTLAYIICIVSVISASLYIVLINNSSCKNSILFRKLRGYISCIEYETANDKYKFYDYFKLYKINSDIVGWLRIDNTSIDYPVMQSKTRDYYLNHDFYKRSSIYGVPYLPTECDINKPSDNIIIYGHHITGGQMFSELDKYKNKFFYEEHKYINFDKINKTETLSELYEIIAVFTTTVYDNKGFKYYTFIDAASEDEYNSFINQCIELSLYQCSANAKYGDKLLTLSTCEYSHKNGRLAVVAKKIK